MHAVEARREQRREDRERRRPGIQAAAAPGFARPTANVSPSPATSAATFGAKAVHATP
jgi:hypothetical protein